MLLGGTTKINAVFRILFSAYYFIIKIYDMKNTCKE